MKVFEINKILSIKFFMFYSFGGKILISMTKARTLMTWKLFLLDIFYSLGFVILHISTLSGRSILYIWTFLRLSGY